MFELIVRQVVVGGKVTKAESIAEVAHLPLQGKVSVEGIKRTTFQMKLATRITAALTSVEAKYAADGIAAVERTLRPAENLDVGQATEAAAAKKVVGGDIGSGDANAVDPNVGLSGNGAS